MARKAARAAAVQMVFENMLGGDGGDDTLLGLIAFAPEEDDQQYIESLLSGIALHGDEIDHAIEKNLRDWTLDRLAKVDVAVLRVAVYEILYAKEVPPSVVINEAVTLAQKFNTPGAGKFVNGLLSSVLAEAEQQQ